MRAGILQNARMSNRQCQHGHDNAKSQGNGVCGKEHIQKVNNQDNTVEPGVTKHLTEGDLEPLTAVFDLAAATSALHTGVVVPTASAAAAEEVVIVLA
jgi:hypothetical protein